MKTVWMIALRYILPRYQQRAVSVMAWIAFSGVALGSATLILALSVLGGFEQALYDNALQFTAHIQMQAPEAMPFPNKQTLVQDLYRTEPRIREIIPFVRQEAIIRTPSGIEGIVIKADAERTAWRATHILRGVKDFASDTAHVVMISERLARKLKTDVGQSIILYSVSADQRTSLLQADAMLNTLAAHIDKYTVQAIYQTGIAEYDDAMIFMPYKSACDFFHVQNGSATGIDILLHDRDSITATREQLLKRYGKRADIWTMFEIHSTMFSWIALQQKPIPIILGLISIVAMFNVITALLMTIVEKIPSIGILRTLGLRRRSVLVIFLLQGMILSVLGAIAGCALAGFLIWIQATFKIIRLQSESYFISYAPVQFAWWHYGVVLGITMVIALLASWIPAWIASRLQPLRALRFR